MNMRKHYRSKLLGEITSGARQCQAVEQQSAKTAPPPLETQKTRRKILISRDFT
jgi:hypothetical protein